MKLLILYHSNILPPKPGADEHIYTTAKLLSGTYNVTVLTWGSGISKRLEDTNLKIIHMGSDSEAVATVKYGKIPGFIMDILSYTGIRYIPFLRKARGPSIKQFKRLNLGFFDIAIRISYNNNRILKYLEKFQGTKIIEFALVSGLPHYLNNKNKWLVYTNNSSALSSEILDIVHKIMSRMVFWFYVSSLSSHNVIAVSEYDKLVLEKIKNFKVEYIPPLHNFGDRLDIHSDQNSILFFSGNDLSARIATEYILFISRKLKNYNFYITGFIPNINDKSSISSNMHLCGFLEDKEFHELIGRSNIIIMPLISGTGNQTKVTEAMHWGKPIITTSAIACEF
ncbi:MAG: glycosyltransferase [Ferroplasma sp.]|uniref:glycosyltransferase n=1 Tax=Ferroplasma sp. TaxID=2591003 RepID=UPI00281525CC|nr:glycosyltransferase [Ferroplasma sp.]WMT50619.1 MAG: glycosyltransferase [Ferroplasma sp.]